MYKNVNQIVSILEEHQRELRFEYHIESIAIFGSVARDEYRKGSDIDLLVRFSELPSFFELAHIEEFLHKRLHMKIDLVIENEIDKDFLRRISFDLIPI